MNVMNATNMEFCFINIYLIQNDTIILKYVLKFTKSFSSVLRAKYIKIRM